MSSCTAARRCLNWTTRRSASPSATPQRTWLIRGCKSSRSNRLIVSGRSSCTRRGILRPTRSSNTIARPGSSASGIASQAQFDQAAHALDAARQQVANVQQQIGVALANLGGDPNIAPERHPLVAQAQAALDRAQLNLSYTVISAPTDGVVAKVEQLQVGDTIAASAPVFALVSTGDVWIEANFKEVQLARMRPGQAATVKIDRYPGRRFSAKVTSVSPSTGSQFSLLPPENATGNWVKVVQRVPVRLQLTHVDAEFSIAGGT